jgi:hypothetical protein
MGRDLVARRIGIMEVDVRSPQFLRHPPHPVRGTWSRQQAGTHPARKKSVPGKVRRAPHTSHHPKIQGFCPISCSVLYGIRITEHVRTLTVQDHTIYMQKMPNLTLRGM